MLALAASGCQTTAEESAKLERSATRVALANKGLAISRASTQVKVLDATLIQGSEGAAAVVTVRNVSARLLRSVPIAITVKDNRGGTLFQNNAPGLEAALTTIASLAPHGEAIWVDDQIPPPGGPASVAALVGQAPVVNGPPPRIEIRGLHAGEGSSSAEGTVRNLSRFIQRSLVVDVLARRAGRILAAGRAIVPEVLPGSSAAFQVFLVGAAHGATLTASASPAAFG